MYLSGYTLCGQWDLAVVVLKRTGVTSKAVFIWGGNSLLELGCGFSFPSLLGES